jgi:hypothetical protein
MGNAALIWTFAGVLAAACFARALAMRGKSALVEALWYDTGAFFLLGASILWVTLEKDVVIQHRIVMAVLGAIFGGLSLYAISLWLRPPTAGAEPSLASPTAPPSQAISPSHKSDVAQSSNSITGLTIDNGGGGTGMTIDNSGGGTGANVVVNPRPGQSATGVEVIQRGPGTGLEVIQNGPGTGLNVTVGSPGQ